MKENNPHIGSTVQSLFEELGEWKEVKKKAKEKMNEELSKIPNAKYQKFFDQFIEIETLPVDQWKVAHLIGYFCQLYQATFNIEYKFKFNTESPSKSFEVWQIKALGAKLSTKPQTLKNYIDWVFAAKASQTKRRFTSISFLTKEEHVNQYKWQVLPNQETALQLTRTAELPKMLLDICLVFNFECKTYGDLAFLYQANKPDIINNIIEKDAVNMFIQLQTAGLNLQHLDKIF